jgi:hypothetical protein
MVKKVTFPLMSPAELAESVRWEAESFFPAGQGLDSYALDFAVIEERPADGNMDVVLVACRKDKMEAYLTCVAQAGAKPLVVDVDVFALQNAYETSASPGARDELRLLAGYRLGRAPLHGQAHGGLGRVPGGGRTAEAGAGRRGADAGGGGAILGGHFGFLRR